MNMEKYWKSENNVILVLCSICENCINKMCEVQDIAVYCSDVLKSTYFIEIRTDDTEI